MRTQHLHVQVRLPALPALMNEHLVASEQERGGHSVTVEDLRAEYRQSGIGPQLLSEMQLVVERVAKRFPASVYARSTHWGPTELDDLVQDVVTDRMLREQQLYWVMLAPDLDDLRARFGRHVKRTLYRRRVRTLKDNLLRRTKHVLENGPFETRDLGRVKYYRLERSQVESRDPTEAELREAAVCVSSIPTMTSRSGRRAPVAYSTEDLAMLVQQVAGHLSSHFSLRDLDAVFDRVLATWIPRFFSDSSEVIDTQTDDLTPEEQIIVDDTATEVMAELSDEQQALLHLKASGIRDQTIALKLQISRPTAAKRKHEALTVLESHLRHLPERVRESVLHSLTQLFARKGRTP